MGNTNTASRTRVRASASAVSPPLFDVHFEDVCFITTRAVSGAELTPRQLAKLNRAMAADRLFPAGVKSVEIARVSDDSEESDTRGDLKRFVSIVLRVEAESADAAKEKTPPDAFLGKIAEAVAGRHSIDVEGGWEITDVDAVKDGAGTASESAT